MSDMRTLDLGLDVGSTTVKAVLLDGTDVLFERYRRHHSDIQVELAKLLAEAAGEFPDAQVRVGVTGSGGLSVARLLDQPFVQEVIAETAAIRRFDPDTDVVIELGGEDAKITYLKPIPEQRMNGTCAGGTGAFIDQMATLLHTDAPGLDELAAQYKNLYPIASRCGVFAKSDLQPLINDGVPSEDLAASIFTAVATQTIAGLACGRPIRGVVALLGGPLHFLGELREAFRRALGERAQRFVVPDRAQLYVAIGAALIAASATETTTLAELVAAAEDGDGLIAETGRLAPLFESTAELEQFRARHARAAVPIADLSSVAGPCYLGIDAGSTTLKAVLLDPDGRLVYSFYAGNQGDPIKAASAIVRDLHGRIPASAWIARSCVTGYGEGLVRTALRIDDGEIETIAHYRAASTLAPDVTSVIDIGGQDMKYLRVRDGVIDSISVNEACSSGCGSFLQTFAETLGVDIAAFSEAALASFSPVDLGSRCTVFMNSSVKQAQKEGATIGDLSAGLSYSVVRNALYKVIKLRDAGQLGPSIVVQGGTFLNDAVLRAFELLTGREVVRPDIAGLMGAYGAALIAKARAASGARSTLIDIDELDELTVSTTMTVCRLCQNHCQCTITTFGDGTRYVSGNRCERGGDAAIPKSSLPNLYDYKYRRLFGYRRLTAEKAHRGDIGVPRVLNMYEDYPLWFTILSELGFRVMISGRSNHEVFEKGMDSIASENVCYPAKLAHGHVMSLIERGVSTIFYPCVTYEQQFVTGSDNHFNCPVVMSYPEVISGNIDEIAGGEVRVLRPFLNLSDPAKLAERLVEAFADYDVSLAEAEAAVAKGFAEADRFREDVRAEGRKAIAYLAERGGRGIVLAGRPYHVDPEVNHGIPELINGLGMAVLTEDSVLGLAELERPLRVRDQWAYHSRLYEAAAVVADHPELELVQLNSFGCGLDAITGDQVQEILEAKNDVYTALKIDEVSNLGAARIRLRSLAAAAGERAGNAEVMARIAGSHVKNRVLFTKKMKSEHTILAPQMSPIHFRMFEAAFRRSGYQMKILEKTSAEDIEVGLRHVNNDACFPAIMVVGQLVNAFLSGKYDPDNCSVIITQTGGMCRATNYTGLLRKGLAEAGFGQVPVLAISVGGLEKNPGFSLSPGLIHRLVKAVVFGDLLQLMLLRVRPYEAEPGSAQRLYERWNDRFRLYFLGRDDTAPRYSKLIEQAVHEFDSLPLTEEQRRPRVGIVGEILVKFHPDANNHVVEVIESEGCEAVLPGMTEFFINSMYTADWNYQNLGVGKHTRHVKSVLRAAVEQYRKPVRRALAASLHFDPPAAVESLLEGAEQILSPGNQAGEGWLLTGEIVELIESGVPNIVCAQPFACLPNHVVGKGMFRPIRRRYPQANIVAVDYDPGASAVNQLNRIKLMVATAKLAADAHPADAKASAVTG